MVLLKKDKSASFKNPTQDDITGIDLSYRLLGFGQDKISNKAKTS